MGFDEASSDLITSCPGLDEVELRQEQYCPDPEDTEAIPNYVYPTLD